MGSEDVVAEELLDLLLGPLFLVLRLLLWVGVSGDEEGFGSSSSNPSRLEELFEEGMSLLEGKASNDVKRGGTRRPSWAGCGRRPRRRN